MATPPDPAALPDSLRPRRPEPAPDRYAGPPRYRSVPRWGLPVGPWRMPPGPDDGPAAPVDRVRWLAGQLVPVLWVVVVMSLIAAAAETWRYTLLLQSRSDALSPVAVAWSDAMVWFGGWSSVAAVIAAGVLTISWSRWSYQAAAERAGTRPWRSRRSIVAGWLVPGWNLAAPGSLLAETEHTALGLPADRRPSPSRELMVWWVMWVACVLLAALALIGRFRTGTQALADGVVVHAWADVGAAVAAYRTIRVVRWITGLLEPEPRGPRELLVRAGPAGEPPTSPAPDRPEPQPQLDRAEPDPAPDPAPRPG
ncbi:MULTISPECIES: DUF4328 domain-containing protein [Pseudonocardia]|uniref:DUF4328 domain-containing protein n=2 Tax=Pseudonocardia TaxID=1847 RepID=A0A1Y2MU76_PSEAH|nr:MULTISPECIES: DUF4328 domain-containing protein [Pseudonocardia]OSY38750.1 hypothetical protein BG845_03953 [Pseudonocardia autotrophica]TDN74952.1 uncharacterized protein DUF4328 [Pseudonocardia autotrophica]GEC27829.1 hypothetical protein PSA01_48580 [Pseudonocardia saturnea]